jgi:hypothetical protein
LSVPDPDPEQEEKFFPTCFNIASKRPYYQEIRRIQLFHKWVASSSRHGGKKFGFPEKTI